MSSLPQLPKQLCPMEVTPSGIVIEVREVQALKQAAPRVVRVEGMMTERRDEQLPKQFRPMEVTPSGIVIEVSL